MTEKTATSDQQQLILHIGAHKTGTSAIQVYLRRNQAKLQARGWQILLPPKPQGRPANWNFLFRIDPGPVFRLHSSALQTMQAQIDKNSRNVILSAEDLFFLEPPEIHEFAKSIASRFDRIHLVAYLRRQDRMAISHWQQAAQTAQSAALFGNPTGPLLELSDAAAAYLDYSARLEAWIAACTPQKVSCRVYDRARLADGDAVTDFL